MSGFYFDERIGNGMAGSYYPPRPQFEDEPEEDEYETEAEREAAEERKYFEDGFPALFG